MSSSQTLNDPALPWDGLHYLQGTPITAAAALNNSIVVLEQWATWCPPCRTSIPHLNSLQQRYAKHGVVILGITNETDDGKLRKFIASMRSSMEYRVAMDTDGVMQEWSDKYRVQGIPHCFVIDWTGRVRWSGHPMAGLDDKLDALVNEFKKWKATHGLRAMTAEQLQSQSVTELMQSMRAAGIDTSGCIEKSDLISRILGKAIQ